MIVKVQVSVFLLTLGGVNDEKMELLSTEVTKTTSLAIVAADESIRLDQPLWAINWFDTRQKWVYNLYTFLASPMVGKVGGSLVFKGSFQERLYGDPQLGRAMLLIVRYPAAQSFLRLVGFKSFLLVSILRIRAVSQFVFGFTRPLQMEKESAKSAKSPVLVHLFTTGSDFSEAMEQLCSLADKFEVQQVYAGKKAATLRRIIKGKGEADIPFFIAGIVVFSASNTTQLHTFFQSEMYQRLLGKAPDAYVGIFG